MRRSAVVLACLAVSGCVEPVPRAPTLAAQAPAPLARCVLAESAPPIERGPLPDVGAHDRVRVRDSDLEHGDGPRHDRRDVADAIRDLWRAWVSRDTPAYAARIAPDVTRAVRATGRIEHGRDDVVAALPADWRPFERDGHDLAVRLRARHVSIAVDGDYATADYAIDVEGGTRWDFDDQWQVLQVFVRRGDRWLLLHQTEGSDPDTGREHPDEELSMADVGFDYAYPVDDLPRAVAFYTDLLGPPVHVTETRATFQLGGARFYLDATRLDGLATVRRGLPNGYPVFHARDVESRVRSLAEAGVGFVTGVLPRGDDRYAVGLDPAGNAFVVDQAVLAPDPSATSALTLTAAPDLSAACLAPTQDYVQSWLHADAATLAAMHDGHARYFDDTGRTSVLGQRDLVRALRARWAEQDRGPDGLAARFEVSDVTLRALGAGVLATYALETTGTGTHGTHERLLVTQLWRDVDGAPGSLTHTFVVRAEPTAAMALAMDYTGAPATDLAPEEDFYGHTLDFGSPYRDEDYVGYWGTDTVFGVYVARPRRDGVPVRGRANGYMSFWVRSIDRAYAFLRAHGSEFPEIGAIVDHAGIDDQPGYRQVLATDSEGNALLLTEYTHD